MNEFKENLQRGAGRGGQDQEDNNDGKAKEDKKDEVNKEKKCDPRISISIRSFAIC